MDSCYNCRVSKKAVLFDDLFRKLHVSWLKCKKLKADVCDPLSENPVHHPFYENCDETGNRYIDV